MSEVKEVKLCLKVMINKEKTKVLFAEADSHFIDLLLSIFFMPLGRIVRTLETHCKAKAPMIGSLTTLYRSIANTKDGRLIKKNNLLNPASHSYEAECYKLKLNFDANQPVMKYKSCKRKRETQTEATDDGVFAMKTASFIISDDLRIEPVVPESSILQMLSNLGITDTNGAKLKTVTFGFNEIKDLLVSCLLSETPLTDIILHRRIITRKCVKNVMHHVEKTVASSSTKKMSVKVIMQKSTNKFLVAQAGKDFVEFVCSLLVIPLGAIEHLLRGKTCLKNIDNMYRSIANINGDKYLKSKYTKIKILKPEIDNCFMPRNHILPLVEEGLLIRPPGHASMEYVKRAATYSITDDLTVTPFSFTCTISLLSGLKIPLSDVKEMHLQIGVEEAMNIMKASLTSTSVLTDGLINPSLMKQPKQER